MRRSLFALGAIVVLGWVGCGGGDDPKQDFITKADAICADLQPESKALDKSDPKTPKDFVKYARRGQKLRDDAVARLDSVPLPSNEEDRKGAEAYIAQVKKASPLVDQLTDGALALQQAVVAKDRDQLQQVNAQLQRTSQEIRNAGKRVSKLTQDYGLKKCGKDA